MIRQDAQLDQLPEYWQEQIRKLRSENRNLRVRLRAAETLRRATEPPSK